MTFDYQLDPAMSPRSPALPAFVSLILMAGLLLTGCGGGGGAPTPPPAPPADLAPASISGRSLTFTDPDQGSVRTTYTFSGNTFTAPNSNSGTYTYTKIAGTTTQATLVINSSFAPPLTYTLTFSSSGGGTYVDQVGKSSTFTIQ